MAIRPKRSKRRLITGFIIAVVVMLLGTAVASAFEYAEEYGFAYKTDGDYIQTGGAHSFTANSGVSGGSGDPYLACQLLNKKEVNLVAHGYGSCDVGYAGGQDVWGRVYNESSGSYYLVGYAHTTF